MSIVTLTGASKSYGGTRALSEVTLSFGTGVTGLLGPNGAGKTTLLRVLATALAPDEGRMTLRGLDPQASHADLTEIRRHLGYLPQELGFPSDMTPYGFVEYIAVLKEWNHSGSRAREVRRVLELVDLDELSAKRISRLSGGQRRRVALAQALVGEPDLVVLDEPTTGLDPEQRATLRRTLGVVARDAAVLLSTHQTEDVAALCERVVVLRQGRVCFDGAVVEMVATAAGQVWLADAPHETGVATWRTGTGRHRVVGGPRPPGGEAAEPTLEDAYLLMLGADAPAPTRS